VVAARWDFAYSLARPGSSRSIPFLSFRSFSFQSGPVAQARRIYARGLSPKDRPRISGRIPIGLGFPGGIPIGSGFLSRIPEGLEFPKVYDG
jgi:hypothetical protein